MIIVILAVLGLVFGSFVNALVWRLHEQERLAKKGRANNRKRLRQLSMLHGRSMCSNCGHELAVKDLVPVASWLYLHGRCRYCHKKIQDNPLVELLTGLVFVASYIWWPLSFQGLDLFRFVVWLAFTVAFVALTVYDLRWLTLPNRIVFPLQGLAGIYVAVVALGLPSWQFAVNALLGSIIIAGLFYVLFQVSDGKWIGGGDAKLGVVIGALAGTPAKAVLVIFFASVFGTIAAIPQLAKGKQSLQAKIPFGPFLLLATAFVVLFGSSMLDWYKGILG